MYKLAGRPIKVYGNRDVHLSGAADGATIDAEHLSRLFLVEGARLTLRNLRLTRGNALAEEARHDGGGIAAADSYVALIDTTISDCIAEHGGGIRASDSSITLTDTHIRGSNATVSGGGMHSSNSPVVLSDCTITDCHAAEGRGSAILHLGGVLPSNFTRVFFHQNRPPPTLSNAGTIYWVCQPGYYQQHSGSQGQTEATADFTDCSNYPCEAGFYGDAPDYSLLTCEGPCPTGYYCPAGATTPTPCPAGRAFGGTTAQDISACSECFPGQYQNATGQASCKPCLAGSYSSTYGTTGCDTCPKGGYCAAAEASSLALAFTPCPAGTYNWREGTSSPEACVECPAGTAGRFSGQSGDSSCESCPTGSYASQSGSAVCTLCSAGSYQNVTRAESCTRCKAGKFCPTGSSFELPPTCEPGQYANKSDVSGIPACFDCERGFACAGGAALPRECIAGSHAPDTRSSSCTLCMEGYYQNETGAVSCRRCSVGSFCPAGSSIELPPTCQPGTYANASDVSGVPVCSDCERGHACAGGASPPTACSPGTYAPDPRSASCTLCAAGSYQNETAAASCKNCNLGSFCPAGSRVELGATCAPGTFANSSDTSGNPLCFDCPAGRRCLGGATQPIECNEGTSSFGGTDTCDLCNAGYYRRSLSEDVSTCTLCQEVRGVSCGNNTIVDTYRAHRTSYTRHTHAFECTHRVRCRWRPWSLSMDIIDTRRGR